MFIGNRWFTVPICGSPHRRGRTWRLSLTNEVWARGTTNGGGHWALSPTLSINTMEKIERVSSGLIINHGVMVLRRMTTTISVHTLLCCVCTSGILWPSGTIGCLFHERCPPPPSLTCTNSLPSVIGDSWVYSLTMVFGPWRAQQRNSTSLFS